MQCAFIDPFALNGKATATMRLGFSRTEGTCSPMWLAPSMGMVWEVTSS